MDHFTCTSYRNWEMLHHVLIQDAQRRQNSSCYMFKRGLIEEKKALILHFGGNTTNIAGLTDNHWLFAEKVVFRLFSKVIRKHVL